MARNWGTQMLVTWRSVLDCCSCPIPRIMRIRQRHPSLSKEAWELECEGAAMDVAALKVADGEPATPAGDAR